jgi:hypothetical protein
MCVNTTFFDFRHIKFLCYIIEQVPHSSFLTFTCSVLILCDRKKNWRISSIILICCKQSVPTCCFLCWRSLRHFYRDVFCLVAGNWKVGYTDWFMWCRKLSYVVCHVWPLFLDEHSLCRILVKTMSTSDEKVQVENLYSVRQPVRWIVYLKRGKVCTTYEFSACNKLKLSSRN